MDTAALQLNWLQLLPWLIVVGGALLVVVADAFVARPSESSRSAFTALTVVVCLGAAFVATTLLWGRDAITFGGMLHTDKLTLLFETVVLVAGALAALVSDRWLARHEQTAGGYYGLLLLSLAGMMAFISAGDMILLFLGLELMSIPIYVLAAADRDEQESVEAGLKYLVLGSFATGVLLFGLSLLYGWAGTTSIEGLRAAFQTEGPLPIYAILGGVLALAGLLFKVGAVPFHMWTPDVYEGAPTPVTAFMAAGVKASAFAVLIRVFAGPALTGLHVSMLIALIAALTMVVGNVAALAQESVKRMLAYSSIGHAGYMLLGLLAGSAAGTAAVGFYAAAYTIVTFVSFGVLILLASDGRASITYADLRGLGTRKPWVAILMTVAMLSLIGLPPTMGFVGKFYLFWAAVEAGWIWLAVLGVLTSAVSLAYYLRVVLVMWFDEGEGVVDQAGPAFVFAMTLAAAALLVFGTMPSPVLGFAMQAVGIYF